MYELTVLLFKTDNSAKHSETTALADPQFEALSNNFKVQPTCT